MHLHSILTAATTFFFRIQTRNLHATMASMKKAVDYVEKNAYYEKYADKIASFQKTSPDEFVSRVEKSMQRNELNTSLNFSEPSKQSKKSMPQSAYGYAPQKKLDSIMKTELLENKSADEIQFIWNNYFMKKKCISGVINAEYYEKIQTRASKYPTFLFPLPKDQGYEFVVAQFANNEIHFTSLINYQTYQENAPENLTIIHYTDLKDSKGIVLMHGEINNDVMSTQEAQFLANQIQLYYGGNDEVKLKLLHAFTNDPQSFKHMDLISQIEQIDLEALTKKK